MQTISQMVYLSYRITVFMYGLRAGPALPVLIEGDVSSESPYPSNHEKTDSHHLGRGMLQDGTGPQRWVEIGA